MAWASFGLQGPREDGNLAVLAVPFNHAEQFTVAPAAVSAFSFRVADRQARSISEQSAVAFCVRRREPAAAGKKKRTAETVVNKRFREQ